MIGRLTLHHVDERGVRVVALYEYERTQAREDGLFDAPGRRERGKLGEDDYLTENMPDLAQVTAGVEVGEAHVAGSNDEPTAAQGAFDDWLAYAAADRL
jgi:hypothetical protein